MSRELPRGLDLVVRSSRVEASLWRRFRLESDAGCREDLFNRYVGMARSVAARFFHRRRPPRPDLSDYQQFACQGLLEAIDRFDPLKGVPFEAFSKKRIAGSIADGVSRMSEMDAQLSARRRAERDRLRSLGRFENQEEALPALAELAVGLAIGLLLEGTNIMAEECAEDPRPSAYESLEYRQLQMRVAECVGNLPEKEAAVVRQHYLNGLDFAQIAELMSLSRGRISQLHHSALERLRKKIGTFA